MNDLLHHLEESYVVRCNNHKNFADEWKQIVQHYPPDIVQHLNNAHPSLLIAQHAGDLGLAIFWIVQTIIVRALLKNIKEMVPHLSFPIEDALIGALAHSEDITTPTIFSKNAETIIISGKKKYITGGVHAQIILLTAREIHETEHLSLFMITREMLPPQSLQKLSLPFLLTVDHASLIMENFLVSVKNLIPIEVFKLRKLLKIWSIIERALIAEAFVGVCHFISSKLKSLHKINESLFAEIEQLLEQTSNSTKTMIESAIADEKIPMIIPFKEIFNCYKRLKGLLPSSDLPKEISLRLNDLSFIEKIK